MQWRENTAVLWQMNVWVTQPRDSFMNDFSWGSSRYCWVNVFTPPSPLPVFILVNVLHQIILLPESIFWLTAFLPLWQMVWVLTQFYQLGPCWVLFVLAFIMESKLFAIFQLAVGRSNLVWIALVFSLQSPIVILNENNRLRAFFIASCSLCSLCSICWNTGWVVIYRILISSLPFFKKKSTLYVLHHSTYSSWEGNWKAILYKKNRNCKNVGSQMRFLSKLF